MGYCTEQDIKNTIAQALTSATSDSTTDLGNNIFDLLNVGNSLDKNLVTSETINYYIQMADSEINSSLSELYSTPFCEKCDFETSLFSPIDEHNTYIVIEKYCPLAAGDIVILKYEEIEERHEIDEVINGTTFSTVNEINYFFPEDTRILRVTYSPPIRFISARLASASIYDKYFSSESSPNVSKYGDKMRELGYQKLNDILNGIVILHGQKRIGNRFLNSNLADQYGLPRGGTMENKAGR